MRNALLIVAGLAAAALVTVTAAASRHAAAPLTGVVTAVPSGNSVVISYKVTQKQGHKKVTVTKRQNVPLFGAVAPTGSSCYSTQSTDALSKLALGQKATVNGNSVTIGSTDLALAQVRAGAAQVDETKAPFADLGTYVAAQRDAETGSVGMWGACSSDIAVSVKGAEKAAPGDYVNYTVTVVNNGPLAAPAVNVELRPGNYAKLIAGLSSSTATCTQKIWVGYCSIASLGVGESRTITLVIRPTQFGGLSGRAVATLVACADTQCGSQPLQDPNLLNDRAAQPTIVPGGIYGLPGHECDPSYPTVCIPPSPPDLDCADIAPLREFRVDWTVTAAPGPDDHHLDGDHNGIACQGDDY